MIRRILIILSLLAIPSTILAQAFSGECGSCVDRKQRICADECELVPAVKARKCQQRCIAEYCKHKCEDNAREIQAYLLEGCDDCLEQQFGLCESHCAVGTPRKKAECQLACSSERCSAACDIGRGK